VEGWRIVRPTRMCTRGVWQLNKLVVRYCEHSGSSQGVRAWLTNQLVPYAKANPQIQFVAFRRPAKHPVVVGEYLTDGTKSLSLKGCSWQQVQMRIDYLRDSRPIRLRKWARPFRVTPSVQGGWKMGQQLDMASHQVVKVA